jgi:hypothetical protein
MITPPEKPLSYIQPMDMIHDVLAEMYPFIQIPDYTWSTNSDGVTSMEYWPEDRFGPLDMSLIEQKCEEKYPLELKRILKHRVNLRATDRLRNIKYDNHVFDLSSGTNELISFRTGAEETNKIFGDDFWGPEEFQDYEVKDLDHCKTFVMSLLIEYAIVTKAGQKHKTDIDKIDNIDDIIEYDVDGGWS